MSTESSRRRASTASRSAWSRSSTVRASVLRRRASAAFVDSRLVPLAERHDAGDHRQHEEHPGRRKERSQTTVTALDLAAFTIRVVSALIEELALAGAQRRRRAPRPVERRDQPRPAVELRGVAAQLVPRSGGVGDVPERPDPLAVLVEPRPQPGPLPDEGLVGDLDRVLARRQEAGVGERPQQVLELRRLLAVGAQLVEGDAAARPRCPPPELGQAEEDRPRQGLLRLGQRHVDRLGGARSPRTPPHSRYPARVSVRSVRRFHVSRSVRQQGQRARLPRHVAEHQVDEPRRS